MPDVASLVSAIVQQLEAFAPDRALLVGISGIDGSGKGYVTAQLNQPLGKLGWNVAAISADDWLNLPHVYMNPDNPAQHFYEHALRLQEMFERLLLPLAKTRSVDIVADCGHAQATVHRKQRYAFININIVLVEGIFLFKRTFRDHFDLKVWVDCPFETALKRAIDRRQEGLPPEETAAAYEKIYFPAQRIHFERDNPRDVADIIFAND